MALWFSSSAFAALGIVCTLDAEYDAVRRLLQAPLVSVHAGRQFTTGNIDGEEVVVVQSPMGKVNNTITAMLLIEKMNVTRILSIGTAGSLSPKLTRGSVLYASTSVFHDEGRYLDSGFVPYQRQFPNINLTRLENENELIFKGLLTSGDQFIAEGSKAEQIRRATGGHAVDTNSGAIFAVCETFDIRCSFLRYITDASNSKSVFAYQAAIRGTLKHVTFVERFIKDDPYAEN